jgi:malate synthase
MSSSSILSYEAHLFLGALAKLFNPRIEQLIRKRPMRLLKNNLKSPHDDNWKTLPPPEEIKDRRVEITGPPVRKMVINAMNSGANVYMADFEDSNSPTYANCIEGQINLRDAVNKTIEYTDQKTNKTYSLKNQTATLFVRPRGLHLFEKNYVVDSVPIAASLFDFGLYFFHNYKQLLKNKSRPYFYLPKLEHYEEARLWNDIFIFSEKAFDLEVGTIRATVLIETLPAAFQMDEILYELREHSAGLNCGRWDYIFSFIKTFSNNHNYVLPDRDQIGMTQHFMRSYTQLLVQTCHKRRCHAIGGMAAQIPIKDDPEANHVAMEKVRADKLREVQDGHDGTWVAHPVLVDVAKEIFDKHLKSPNQIDKQIFLNSSITKYDLLCVPKGQCTEDSLRKNIRIAFQYINSWLNGNGCVPIDNLMEDAATAEISRAQLWHWCKFRIYLNNGKQVTKKWLTEVIKVETKQYEHLKRFEETSLILFKLCFSEKLIDFLTAECYDLL